MSNGLNWLERAIRVQAFRSTSTQAQLLANGNLHLIIIKKACIFQEANYKLTSGASKLKEKVPLQSNNSEF